jgi:glutamate dehydrogenase
MLIETGRLVVRASVWFLRRRREKFPISEVLEIFRPGVASVSADLKQYLSRGDAQALQVAADSLTAQGVPPEIAARVASLDALFSVLDIVEVGAESKRSIELVAAIYFSLIGRLDLRWLHDQVTRLPTETHWQYQARTAIRDDLATQQRLLASSVLKLTPDGRDPNALLARWEAHQSTQIARMREVIADLRAGGTLDLAMLSVALRELRGLG